MVSSLAPYSVHCLTYRLLFSYYGARTTVQLYVSLQPFLMEILYFTKKVSFLWPIMKAIFLPKPS